jgi:hypothetical protein
MDPKVEQAMTGADEETVDKPKVDPTPEPPSAENEPPKPVDDKPE